jgi:hypothetical protein
MACQAILQPGRKPFLPCKTYRVVPQIGTVAEGSDAARPPLPRRKAAAGNGFHL